MHICVGNLTIIGRRQAIIRTSAGMLLIEQIGTNSSEILNSCIFIQENAFENVCEMVAILFRTPCVAQCSSLEKRENVLLNRHTNQMRICFI